VGCGTRAQGGAVINEKCTEVIEKRKRTGQNRCHAEQLSHNCTQTPILCYLKSENATSENSRQLPPPPRKQQAAAFHLEFLPSEFKSEKGAR
jgi:hypothetical protein